jgi:hypothetical protein
MIQENLSNDEGFLLVSSLLDDEYTLDEIS